MIVLNPGNILPFYANKKSKLRYRCGCGEFNWAIPVNKGESLSVQFPVPAAPLGTYLMELLDEDEVFYSSPITDYLLYSEDVDGNAWITIRPDIAFLTNLDCGVYSIHIYSRERYSIYSEDFRVMDMGEKKKAYRFVFSNDTDIDGIIYQGGYTQKFWLLDAVFDTPANVEAAETATDGDAVEVLTFQSLQTRDVLKFPYFPDFWHSVFPRLRMLDNLETTKLETNETFDLAGRSLAFEAETQDVCFTKGVLSWIAHTQVTTGCAENKTMVILDNH